MLRHLSYLHYLLSNVNFKLQTVLIGIELTCKLYTVGKIIKLDFQYILQIWIRSFLKEVMTNSLQPVQTQDKMQKCQIRNKNCIDWARSNVHAIYHWKDNWVSFPINFTELNLEFSRRSYDRFISAYADSGFSTTHLISKQF